MSTVKATIYNTVTGAVELAIEASDKETILAQPMGANTAIHWGEAYTDGTIYFARGLAVPRPIMGLLVNPGLAIIKGSVITVTNVPENCVVTYPGGVTTVNGGKAEWGSVVPGEYVLKFELFPYLSEVLNVSVRNA